MAGLGFAGFRPVLPPQKMFYSSLRPVSVIHPQAVALGHQLALGCLQRISRLPGYQDNRSIVAFDPFADKVIPRIILYICFNGWYIIRYIHKIVWTHCYEFMHNLFLIFQKFNVLSTHPTSFNCTRFKAF